MDMKKLTHICRGLLTNQKLDSMRRTSQFYKCLCNKKLSKLFASQLTNTKLSKLTKNTKVLSEWAKSMLSREKDKDLSKRRMMTLSLQSSKESKSFPLLISNLLENTIPNLRKYWTASSKLPEATTIEIAAANNQEV